MAELVQEVLQPYAGPLLPPTSEGITGVFGAPVAQEDHARWAVLAALELCQRLDQHPALQAQLADADLAMRMRVYSGLVVGEFGQDAQRFATVVGAPVHLARRLQEQAVAGTILLSAATYQLVHAEVRVAPGGSIVVDSSPTPMPVYTVPGLLGHLIREEAQQRPLLLAVEDVHWIDPTSAAWLAFLIDRLTGATVLALPPLRAEESQAIVATVPGTAQLSVAQCQQIIAHGMGNPFFVEELA